MNTNAEYRAMPAEISRQKLCDALSLIQEQHILVVGNSACLALQILQAAGKDCVVKLCHMRQVTGNYGAVYIDSLSDLKNQLLVLKRLFQLSPVLYLSLPLQEDAILDEAIKQCGWTQTHTQIVGACRIVRYCRGKVTVVYTAIFGDKDRLRTPKIVEDGVSYICFTDNVDIRSDVWNIWYCRPTFSDMCRSARFYKLLSHRAVFCDKSVWVDANVQLDKSPTAAFAAFDEPLALYAHAKRDCAYNEAVTCKLARKDSRQAIDKTVAWLQKIEHPKNAGMFNASIVFRRHCNETIEFNELWWDMLSKVSRRDQLSIVPCLRQLKTPHHVFPAGNVSEYGKRQKHIRKYTKSLSKTMSVARNVLAANASWYVEIGIGDGVTTRKVCEILHPGAVVHIYDRNVRVPSRGNSFETKPPDVFDKLVEDFPDIQLRAFWSSTRRLDSYCWQLGKVLEEYRSPIYDYVYLDGSHTWTFDALAFLLVDRLLKVGGQIEFDDYAWTLSRSRVFRPRRYRRTRYDYTKEQITTQQVAMVVDLLVKTDPRYTELIPNRLYQKHATC